MLKEESNVQNNQIQPPGWYPGSYSDEIDLSELIIVLWRKKLLILLITGLFTAAGIAYALLAPQVWSAKAVIKAPLQQDLLPMTRIANQAMLLGLTGFPSSKVIHDDFIREFNSYDNQREYLQESELFKRHIATAKPDEQGKRRWLRDWSKFISAEPVDEKGNKPGVRLTTSADTSEHALKMLEDYIDFIIVKQNQSLVNELTDQKSLRLDTLTMSLKLTSEDARQALKRDIINTELAVKVAKAAGVTQPLENYNSSERFPINLGTQGLEEKLKLLKIIDLNIYQPKLAELQIQIERLKQVRVEAIRFKPFSYLDAPEVQLSRDKPKRPLIVVLATLLGGMLSASIVLIRRAFISKKQHHDDQ
ncbi:LPS O-antigen chain length determinant protein WzzB [Aeromonas aquatica]|uniref:LPS O-antigen chain length determinant protein WzzB n=3 Tax=Aeromonadaceae TaxID=84642 RepID=UPI001F4AA691|nr:MULTISPECIES: Wzz/FepE/Etk N-terminal domain-containing protein [Aeromonas]MCH7372118.1 Wzz/FepE/Etk N-terminal domain-containing protein [Aeromonas sp. MR16]